MNIKELRELKPGRIYWIYINNIPNAAEIEKIRDDLDEIRRRYNIDFIITAKGMMFIDAPKGYEIRKIKEV